jgi:hypothetical protein
LQLQVISSIKSASSTARSAGSNLGYGRLSAALAIGVGALECLSFRLDSGAP